MEAVLVVIIALFGGQALAAPALTATVIAHLEAGTRLPPGTTPLARYAR